MILKNGKRIDGCSDTVPIGTVNPFLGAVAPFGYLLLQGQKESKAIYPELWEICGDTFGQSTETEFYLPDLRGQTIAGYKEGDSVFGTLGGLIGNKSISYTPRGTNSDTAVILNAIELTHSGGAVGNHTLTTDEMPSHGHTINFDQIWGWGGTTSIATTSGGPYGGNGYVNNAGGSGAHNHGFTQPTAHSFTPTTKSIVDPTFSGVADDIDVVQPTVTLNWIVKAVMLIPNQSTVVNSDSDSTTNVYSCNCVNDLLEQMKRETFDFAHPVGSYYETSDSTWTPDNAGWYGTWEADNDGSVLASYKSSGAFNKSTGTIVGAESISYTPEGINSDGAVGNHTLTVDEMPAHNHQQWSYSWKADGTIMDNEAGTQRGLTWAFDDRTGDTGGSDAHNHSFTQPTFTGTEATLSTIQPSKIVYRWHRVA